MKATKKILILALLGVMTHAFWMDTSGACESCSMALLDEVIDEKMDTWVGEHVLEAARNQEGLPLGGLSRLQKRSEEKIAHVLVAQLEKQQQQESIRSVASKTGFNLNRILARDAALPIPTTSFVDQKVKADKVVEIYLNEGKTYIGNGVIYDGFLINDKVPGPTVRVTEGDIVEFRVTNDGSVPHGASIHSAYTQSSAYMGKIPPGETKVFKFKATIPGVYMYHCAPGGHAIAMHVIGGQYGMMIVEPKKKYRLEQLLGHKPDIEIDLIQHELYSNGKDAIEGNAPYTMFNGKLFRYVEEPIVARPGDYVRINFLNIGPNNLSTFHIVGVIWDFAYWQGHPDNRMNNGQSITAGPTDSFVIEFRVPPDEGAYTMLSHAVGSTSRGAIGLLVADKNAKPKKHIEADGPFYDEEQLEEHIKKSKRTISPFKIGTPDVDRPYIHKDPKEELVIKIIGNSFYPKVVEIPEGTKVTWINEEAFTYLAGEFSGIHNVVITDGPEFFSSPMLGHAETYTHTFTKKGDYSYMCAPHPYMEGKVRVVAAKSAGGNWLTWMALLFAAIALFMGLKRKG